MQSELRCALAIPITKAARRGNGGIKGIKSEAFRARLPAAAGVTNGTSLSSGRSVSPLAAGEQ